MGLIFVIVSAFIGYFLKASALGVITFVLCLIALILHIRNRDAELEIIEVWFYDYFAAVGVVVMWIAYFISSPPEWISALFHSIALRS